MLRKKLILNKIVNNLTVMLFITIVLIVFNIACDWIWPRVPEPTDDLSMVVKKDEHHLFNPVPSPDGRLVYFLDDSISKYNCSTSGYGELHVFSLNDSTDRFLLSGQYDCLSMSSDGTKLALPTGYSQDTSVILIVDTAGQSIDSVFIIAGYVREVHFARTENTIFYNICYNNNSGERTVFYRKNLSGDTTTNIVSTLQGYYPTFAVVDNDTIFSDTTTGFWRPAVNPTDTRWVIFTRAPTTYILDYWSWRLFDRSRNKLTTLSRATVPKHAWVNWPAWTPDGKDIIFSSGDIGGAEGTRKLPGELWILKNVFDYR